MRRIRVLLAVAVVLVGACNFDDSFEIDVKIDPGRPGPELFEPCSEQAAAACAYVQRCSGFVFDHNWPDLATCTDRATLACQLRGSDPHTQDDEERIRACLVPADFPCQDDPGYEAAYTAYRTTCPEAHGDLPNGSGCATSDSCASDYCDTDFGDQVCGTCGTWPCSTCGEDDLCSIQIDHSVTCTPLHEDGEACVTDNDCRSFWCAGGVCKARAGEGEACDPHASSCESTTDAWLYCNATTSRCERVVLADEGESCDGAQHGYVDCAGGTTCLPHDNQLTCFGPAEDGAPCFVGQGLRCQPPAECIEGYCRFLAPVVCSDE